MPQCYSYERDSMLFIRACLNSVHTTHLAARIFAARWRWEAAWKGGCSAHSSYTRQPSDHMSLLSLYSRPSTTSCGCVRGKRVSRPHVALIVVLAALYDPLGGAGGVLKLVVLFILVNQGHWSPTTLYRAL